MDDRDKTLAEDQMSGTMNFVALNPFLRAASCRDCRLICPQRKRQVLPAACDQLARRANQQNLSIPFAKNIPLHAGAKSASYSAHLIHQRGVGHVTNARWDAVDADGAG
jgi:hypothetical protein